jgi:hypothetical protein
MANTFFSWGLDKATGDLVLYSGDFAYARIRHSAGDKFFATCHDNKKGREFFTKAMAMEWAEIQLANWQGCEVTA